MAKVLKCDICGRCFPYTENDAKEIDIIISEYFNICSDCVEAIRKARKLLKNV